MKKIVASHLKVLALLAVVVPIGLLVAFRLTGVLPEPEAPITIVETVNLETIKWEFERPYVFIDLREKIQSFYDDDVAIVQGIVISQYDPDDAVYGGSSSVSLAVNITSTVPVGYISNIRLTFREDYKNARINLLFRYGQIQFLKVENLSIIDFKGWANEIFINLTGTNRPARVSSWVPVHWVLRSPNNQSHQLDGVLEIVYFNGTAYKKVAQPFQLRLFGKDDNDGFETADEITLGTLKAYIDVDRDQVDYYRVWLERGQAVNASLLYLLPNGRVGGFHATLNLYVYDPNRELAALSTLELNRTRQILFSPNLTGWWYIKIEPNHQKEVYLLNLTPLPSEGS